MFLFECYYLKDRQVLLLVKQISYSFDFVWQWDRCGFGLPMQAIDGYSQREDDIGFLGLWVSDIVFFCSWRHRVSALKNSSLLRKCSRWWNQSKVTYIWYLALSIPSSFVFGKAGLRLSCLYFDSCSSQSLIASGSFDV